MLRSFANVVGARCAVCGDDDCAALFEGGDRRHPLPGTFRMVSCRSCGHVYLNPRPDPESLSHYYPESYAPFDGQKGWLGGVVRALRRREADALRRRLPAGARIVELGCAGGDLLAPLRDRGLEVVGVEPSAQAAAAARAKGLPVHCGRFAEAPLEEGAFDAVVMRSVIEHVDDPLADLRRAHALLKHGGLIVVTTDNCRSLDRRVFGQDWYGFDVPRHLNLFTPGTLGALLERAGFRVDEVRFSLVPTHWIVSARYLLERRFGSFILWRTFSPKNPLLLAAFLPLTFAQRLLGNGGRMALVGVKA